MEERLLKLIDLGRMGHRILPIDETETTDFKLRGKKVLARRLIDDGRTLTNWKPLTPYANLSLKKAPEENQEETVCFTAKSNLDHWLPGRGLGRIYSEPAAMRVLDHEDLTEWNRISVWIFPHVPGMKSLCVRVQLYNEGEHPVPDKYMREGAHNVNLKADQWNHVTCEIPNLHRNDVVGIAIEYDMCGHEPDTVDTNEYYIRDLEIQKVEAQTETGWIPMDGVIAFSGSGYLPTSEKLAIANMNLSADTFRIIETETGKCVFAGDIRVENGLKVMDFTALTQEGRYILLAGENSTRAFDISPRAFEASAWKLINFYLSQRCGCEVAGKHRLCHTDLLLKHPDGRAIVANGGWHDAADLAQGMNNTADGTIGLLRLSERLKGSTGARGMLYERVLEEAKWGLDYVLKVRFGDGYRSSYSSLSIWTDGIIGTNDDIVSHPTTNPFTNFVSACAEALGAYVFKDIDPVYSRYALKIAKEDFRFAEEAWKNDNAEIMFNDAGMQEVKLYAASVSAAAELIRAGAVEFEEEAAKYARGLIECQQRETPDWDTPIRGFFWQNRAHTVIWHHAHHSFEQYLTMGLSSLCQLLPGHKDIDLWKESLSLYLEYSKAIIQYTSPWNMLPEGIYHENEAIDYPEITLGNIILGDEENLLSFKQQVHNGIALGKGYYLRRFPVWFSFRGNENVLLSQALAVAAAAEGTGDKEALEVLIKQLEWTVGNNPFNQSLIYGEGYNWTDEYAVQPGQTIGQMPVGIQSLFDADEPYWPQVCTATYKEVWIAPANKWVWALSYIL